ncbi:murein L,D-transpeptidase catalytic domain family protein [Mucilaginibacter psychrotolerans]|uniref:Murein L,D-transpeptidase catalytic domain family protein n=1 Tax=Mucilaginibacter psychrotolerans TaxID=1524096 RepID=A0A4Y8SEI9_9SPHI|nr:murein L,D-transpeptidase catalytic domain family protein [Mucilaginibacter psychrotolerans]TFF37298.1 murein L,D-transpeptidase catalytic domain family protein [Mucilaginibacter psychrotolerans]
MRKHFWWAICVLMLISVSVISWKPSNASKNIEVKSTPINAKEYFTQYVNDIYQTAQLQQTGMDITVFQKAITGYLNLKLSNKLLQNSEVITVVDFNKSSREKRMWIIDVVKKSLLLNTWVAHGQGSGNDMATAFSNNNESHQSSLGFYLTQDVYIGKHGRSLRLDGLDAGVNNAALARGIVIHAADYVCQNTINQIGRLGRSFGCPAVSPAVSDLVINTIKGRSMLFINGSSSNYTSKLLDPTAPLNYLMPNAPATISADSSRVASL